MNSNTGGDADETFTLDDVFAGIGEHLSELRKRAFYSLIALFAGIAVSFVFADSIMAFLSKPIGGLEMLQSIEVTENVTSVFRVLMLSGLILSSPIILYQLLAFLLPALHDNEKKLLFTALPVMIFLFLAGVAFAYFLILPVAIPFLTSFMGIDTAVRPANYFSFTTNLLFWIGVVFEMPAVFYLVARLGFIRSATMLKNWRQAVVVCAILAMIITPTVDPLNMLILMFPLISLYFLSVLTVWFAEKRRNASPKSPD